MKLAAVVFGMLAMAPVAAIAQTSGHEHTPGTTGPSAGAPTPMPMQGMMPMHGMMEPMQQMMRQMADGLKSGTMTPEQQKVMGQTLERMTAMMDQMHRMAAERQAMHERMSQMMQQMGDMQKRMGEMMGHAPSAAPRPPMGPSR
jgi:hypothetical protein